MKKMYCTAVVLAAGSGSRMKSRVAKQFLELKGKPLIYYALETMQNCEWMDDILLVTGADDIEYVRREIVEKYHFYKVRDIIAGGSERCFSVANAMQWLEERKRLSEMGDSEESYVFIHDGARPFVNQRILEDTLTEVRKCKACVAAVPSKDTIKIVDSERYAVETPDRSTMWAVQTPQVFEQELIVKAYAEMLRAMEARQGLFVTDDASVVELFTEKKVRLVEASYRNIKVTTPEDMVIAEAFLK